jgi:hypothetical protein
MSKSALSKLKDFFNEYSTLVTPAKILKTSNHSPKPKSRKKASKSKAEKYEEYLRKEEEWNK